MGCQVPPDCCLNAGVDVETFCGAGREGRGSVAPIYIQILEPRLCLITTGLRCQESALGSKSKEREKLSKSKNTSPWKTAEISWQEALHLVKLLHTGVSRTDFAKLCTLFCIDVITLRCKVSPTGCSIVVFSHSDKSRKQPLQTQKKEEAAASEVSVEVAGVAALSSGVDLVLKGEQGSTLEAVFKILVRHIIIMSPHNRIHIFSVCQCFL